MKFKIYFLLLIIVFRAGSVFSASLVDESNNVASETIELDRLDKEITTLARQNNIETSKRMCVDYWTQPNQLKALSKFATISEQCSCVQNEMKYLVTDELANALIKTQIQSQGNSTLPRLSDEVIKNTINEWGTHLNSSYRTCSEKFMSRRR